MLCVTGLLPRRLLLHVSESTAASAAAAASAASAAASASASSRCGYLRL